ATAPAADPYGDSALQSGPQLPPSEAEQARGLPILGIEVVGNHRIGAEDIMSYLHTRTGALFNPDDITRDVRELWDSGFFDDIVVDLARRSEGVHLRFTIRERSQVKNVTFTGNMSIDAEKLSEAIEVKPDTILSYPAIRRSVQKIRDMYAEDGYFLAETDFEVIPRSDNQVTIAYKITEHEQVSVRRVTIVGNESVSTAELREIMYTGHGHPLLFGSGGPFRQDAFERDVMMVSSLYHDRGYLSIQVAAPRVDLTPDRTGIEVTLGVIEGPQYKIRRLRVYDVDPDGREIEPIGGRRALREMLRAKPGDVFKRAEMALDIQRIRTLYRDAGYANVEADPIPDLDPERALVDVVIPIRRGPIVHIERITIRGNTKTRDKVIRREMEIEEGDQFSETKLADSRRRIIQLGYFDRVDFSEGPGSDDTKMRVTIEVVERPTGTFQVGAGFSSIESFIANAQIQQANLFGTGQSLALQGQISGLRQLINIRFVEPYLFDSEFSFSLELYDQLRIYDDFSQTSLGGAGTIGYAVIRPNTFASMTYTGEYDKVSTVTRSTFLGTSSAVSVFRRLPLANLFRDGLTSSLRPALTYDSRDNRLFPTSGVYLRGSVEWAAPQLGSDNEFVRYSGTGRFYYPLGKGFVAKINTSLGYVSSPNPEGVPIFARFFLGGIFDVRGFRLRTIGPRLPLASQLDPNAQPITNGANIGGNLMYYQNIEIEVPIVESLNLNAVIFTDAGNAWNTEGLYCNAARGQGQQSSKSLEALGVYAVNDPCFSFSSLGNLRTSWGMGLRWFSPMGPLRFEWGFPFRRLAYEESSVFEFTIGNFF
ncbi:MAG: outer membrane protein assembly factor BamA, partial [Polyangiaceae bacterium]|nr:outer membrane protein assembly factor BamA [Polyangiaceae bacterium]